MIDNVDDALDERERQNEANEEQAEGRELRARIAFAMDVRAFLDGQIGQRLLADAEARRKELVEELVLLDPDVDAERARIRKIRQEVGIIDHWQRFFSDYLIDGEAAAAQFRESGMLTDS